MVELLIDLFDAFGAKLIDFCAAFVPDGMSERKQKTLRVVFTLIALTMAIAFIAGVGLIIHSQKTRTAGIVLLAVSTIYFIACLVKDVIITFRKK